MGFGGGGLEVWMLPSAFLQLHRWLPASLVFLQESRGYFCPAVRVSGQIDWKQDSPPGREGGGELGGARWAQPVQFHGGGGGRRERAGSTVWCLVLWPGPARWRRVQQVRLLWIFAAHKHKPGVVIFGTARMYFFLNFIRPDCCCFFFLLFCRHPSSPWCSPATATFTYGKKSSSNQVTPLMTSLLWLLPPPLLLLLLSLCSDQSRGNCPTLSKSPRSQRCSSSTAGQRAPASFPGRRAEVLRCVGTDEEPTD